MIVAADPIFVPSFLGERMQLGFVVADLNAALRFWTETMKVGPFVVIENSLGDRQFMHRGRATDVQMSIGYSYLGDMQIEVIVQTNSTPSPYTEFLATGRQGLHHLAFWPQDYEQACREVERLGFEEISCVQMSDGAKNVSYFSGPAHLGVMIELVPMTEARMTYFAGIKALASTWDGSRPVRRFATRADYMASDDCTT